jgi:hypothetical protein
MGGSDPEAELRAAFEKKYGDETWFHHITGIEVKDDGLEIKTDLDPKLDFETWSRICGQARGVAIDTGAIDSGEFAHVTGRNGVGGADCA